MREDRRPAAVAATGVRRAESGAAVRSEILPPGATRGAARPGERTSAAAAEGVGATRAAARRRALSLMGLHYSIAGLRHEGPKAQ